MTSYDEQEQAPVRTPVTLVVMTLDFCGRTFGVAPCTASGTPCYNTYITCRAKAAYLRQTRDYKFTSRSAALPFSGGIVRPYLDTVKVRPTEIVDNLPVNGRETYELADDPQDTDIGIDPYTEQRGEVPTASFFKRLLARNPNYIRRPIRRLEGYLGIPESEFRERFVGAIDAVKGNQGKFSVEAVDLLKSLDDIFVPSKMSLKLAVDLAETTTLAVAWRTGKTIIVAGDYSADWNEGEKLHIQRDDGAVFDLTVKTVGAVGGGNTEVTVAQKHPGGTFSIGCRVENLDRGAAATEMTLEGDGWELLDAAPGRVRIGDEIILFTARVDEQHRLTGCIRGSDGTAAAPHSRGDAVQAVAAFAAGNAFDHLKDLLLERGGIEERYVNVAEIDSWRDWPGGEPDFSALISEPTQLSDLVKELTEILDCKIWVAEDLRITLRRNMPNHPGRTYRRFSQGANICDGTTTVDENPSSRISRVIIYWNPQTPLAKVPRPTDWNDTRETDITRADWKRIDIGIDAEAEGPNLYGTEAVKVIFARWLSTSVVQEEILVRYVERLARRRINAARHPQPLFSFDVERKDGGVKTGEYVKISTSEMLNADGSPLVDEPFQVVRVESKGQKISLKTIRITDRRWFFIAPAGTPAYGQATEAQKEFAFISGADGRLPDGREGYHIYPR